jgi:hypothetical protein
MKDSTNYQQLWSDINTGKSFILKASGDSLKIIKTDPQGNSRTEDTYGPKIKPWEA